MCRSPGMALVFLLYWGLARQLGQTHNTPPADVISGVEQSGAESDPQRWPHEQGRDGAGSYIYPPHSVSHQQPGVSHPCDILRGCVERTDTAELWTG